MNDLLLNDRLPLMEQTLNCTLIVVTICLWWTEDRANEIVSERKYDILHYLLGIDGIRTDGVRWYMCVRV